MKQRFSWESSVNVQNIETLEKQLFVHKDKSTHDYSKYER